MAVFTVGRLAFAFSAAAAGLYGPAHEHSHAQALAFLYAVSRRHLRTRQQPKEVQVLDSPHCRLHARRVSIHGKQVAAQDAGVLACLQLTAIVSAGLHLCVSLTCVRGLGSRLGLRTV